MILVWNGGEFARAKGISAADRGLLLGDGLFETIRVEDGAPRRLSRHMRRLASSARVLDLPVPVSATVSPVPALVALNTPADMLRW